MKSCLERLLFPYLVYTNPPPTYSRGLDSQRLRTPSTILRDRFGGSAGRTQEAE